MVEKKEDLHKVKFTSMNENYRKQLERTLEHNQNLVKTSGKVIGQQFDKAASTALTDVLGGKMSADDAIEKAVKQLGGDGAPLKVQYPSGRQVCLDAALATNVRTMSKRVALYNDLEMGEQLRADHWEITAFADCAADHLWLNGQIFTTKQMEDLEVVEALQRPNCRHTAYPYWPGYSNRADFGLSEEEKAASNEALQAKLKELGVDKGGIINYAQAIKPVSSTKQAVKLAKDVLGLDVEYDKLDINVANMINKEVAKAYDIFGNLHKLGSLKSVTIDQKMTNYYAAYDPHLKSLHIPKQNYGIKNALEKIKFDTTRQKSLGNWSTAEVEHTIRHELGHAIDDVLIHNKVKNRQNIETFRLKTIQEKGIKFTDKTRDTDLQKAKTVLSFYGLKNTKECIAESVAEYMSGKTRVFANTVVNMLIRKA